MAKKKKKKTRAKKKGTGIFSVFLQAKKKKKKKKSHSTMNLKDSITIIGIVLAAGAFAVGLIFLNDYVKEVTGVENKSGFIELVDPPWWVNDVLIRKIRAAATSNGQDLKLDEGAAESIQQNIAAIAWIADAVVQTTHQSFRISGRWRKPIALIKSGRFRPCYVDDEFVVLDLIPIEKLPIVEITGLARPPQRPGIGDTWLQGDLEAATEILMQMQQMDELVTPDKPLLFEIDRIDISNFHGRKSSSKPHIVMYTKDGTKIIWGAEFGLWQQHLEATDAEKLAGLYQYYKEHGSLSGGAKYINLLEPQRMVPEPVDKY